MPCIVDKSAGEIYPDCVIDQKRPGDCSYAKDIRFREECEFWEIPDGSDKLCPYCGQPLPEKETK